MGKVGGTTNRPVGRAVDNGQSRLGCLAGGNFRRLGSKRSLVLAERSEDAGGQVAGHGLEKSASMGRGRKPRFPRRSLVSRAPARPLPGALDPLRDDKRWIVPSKLGPCGGDFRRTQWGAVGGFRSRFVRRSIADNGLASDERGPIRSLSAIQRGGHLLRLVAIHALHMPATSLQARKLIHRGRQSGGSVN